MFKKMFGDFPVKTLCFGTSNRTNNWGLTTGFTCRFCAACRAESLKTLVNDSEVDGRGKSATHQRMRVNIRSITGPGDAVNVMHALNHGSRDRSRFISSTRDVVY